MTRMKVGDKVSLKGHSRVMIVRCVPGDQAVMDTGIEPGVHCDWIDDSGNPHRHAYYPEQLELIDDHDR